ncbi:hypothetical protein FSP39_004002 [Pinctada imbricata]|uniref:Small acidic protein-like domain-containing protein n=1 Tax=Pinctada imbricata TaxID=66713 RepID=A0AA89BJ37_PINIB|nr:hypothetical protein FSP39_004002 [Pinctada imbricata]
MISDGTDEFGHDTQPVSKDHYLIDGIVAYPGMPSLSSKQTENVGPIKETAAQNVPSKSATSSNMAVALEKSRKNEESDDEVDESVRSVRKSKDEKESDSSDEEDSRKEEGITEVKKGRSLADDVMKLLGSSSLSQELDTLPRPRSRSHSSDSSRSSSSDGSRSVTPASSPDRKSADPDDAATVTKETGKSDRDKDVKSTSRGRQESTSSVSSSKGEKSSSKRHASRHKRSHSRERSRSRSRSREKTRDRVDIDRPSTSRKEESEKHLTFKEKMRQQLLKASKYLQSGEGLEGISIDGKSLDTPKEKPSNLPLNEKNFFAELASSTKSNVTPQVALLHTMAAMHQKAQEMTGVAVPKYYNPAAVNPLKYAEQVQKRKLLWSKAKDHKEDKEKEWGSSAFASDQSGKMAAKFRKLMGIKHEDGGEGEEGPSTQGGEMTEEQIQKQQELFSRLDKEYEFARMTTHTHRGVGLGFSSQGGFPNT